MFLSKINVSLRKSILDPQGKTVMHSLESLGFKDIHDLRMGKYIEMKIDAASKDEAEMLTKNACEKLLVNSVMEDYDFKIEKLEN
ncbi:phosphoribosylformylglycinamidine synthase subunit PurS [soil metagenome]